MSRAEEITSEVRKLVMTCRAMEAQLQQSIPKKTHQEVVGKMQAAIDSLTSELEKSRSDLRNTISVGERVDSLVAQVSTQGETVSNLSTQVTSSQKEILETQTRMVESLSESVTRNVEAISAKLSRDTVPVLLYNETLSRISEMEEKLRFMVQRADYVAVQKRCDELSEKLTTMVPMSEYIALQSQFVNFVPKSQFEEAQHSLANSVPIDHYREIEAKARELEARLMNSVPRDEYIRMETRIGDLEVRLAASVPRADYDELTARIASLTKDIASSMEITPHIRVIEEHLAQSGAVTPQPVAVAQVAIEAPKPVAQADAAPAAVIEPVVEPVATLVVEPVSAAVEEPVVAPVVEPVAEVQSTPEIAEVQSQLSEIKGVSESGATEYDPAAESSKKVDASLGFKFLSTEFCARSGLEFLDDLERAPLDSLESHAKNGDFERWFRDVLQDENSSESIKAVREGNFTGEELRAKLVAVIAPRYRA